MSLVSAALQAVSLPLCHSGSPFNEVRETQTSERRHQGLHFLAPLAGCPLSLRRQVEEKWAPQLTLM